MSSANAMYTSAKRPAITDYAAVPGSNKRHRKIHISNTDSNVVPHIFSSKELPTIQVPQDLALRAESMRKGFSTGAVIAVRLVDFQVATDATYRFMPNLNMILGNNGSGKSTIITALFLLFQGRIADLQHKTYGEFVRYGCKKSIISVIIQGKAIDGGDHNPCIAAVLTASESDGLRSRDRVPPQWYIDGLPISTNELESFIERYNIRVNNLCQFLPQFRVAAFSSESKIQRLISTEEAVGYKGMLDDHRSLSQIDNELSDITADLEDGDKLISRLTLRRNELEERITAVEETLAYQEQLTFLENVYTLMEHRDIQNTLDSLNVEYTKAEADLKAVADEQKVALELVANIRREIESGEREMRKKYASKSRAVEEAKDIFTDHKTTKTNLENVLQNIENTESELIVLESQMNDASKQQLQAQVEEKDIRLKLESISNPEFNELSDRIQEVNQQIIDKESVIGSLNDQKDTRNSEMERVVEKIRQKSVQLKQLQNREASGRDISKIKTVLQSEGDEIERGINFVKENAHKFKKPIIYPAIASVSITDKRVLPMFSTVVSIAQLKKFVCQTSEDQVLLTRLCGERPDINIQTVHLFGKSNGIDANNIQKLKEQGFDGVLSDILKGPEPMLDFLNSLQLNCLPYALNPITDDVRAKIRSHDTLNEYVDSKMHYKISKSRYGRKQVTETSNPLEKASRISEFMMEVDYKPEISALESQILRFKEDHAEFKKSSIKIDEELSIIQTELSQLKEERRSIKQALQEESTLKFKLKTLQKKKKNLDRKLETSRADQLLKIEFLKQQGYNLQKSLKSITKNKLPKDVLENTFLIGLEKQRDEIIIKDKYNKVKVIQESIKLRKESLKKTYLDAKQRRDDFVKEHEEDYTNFDASVKWLDDNNMREKAEEVMEKHSYEDLKKEVGKRKYKLQLADEPTVNIDMLRIQLKDVITNLEDAQNRQQLNASRKHDLTVRIKETRLKWESALLEIEKKISSEFSNMFASFGCKGRVEVSKDDINAVGTWGIDIFVSFRKNEKESPLTRQRQSGGERAVSTAVYLLALQQLANVPFRVLDEINQGMDEHNERRTLEFFVKYACENSTSGTAQQYFLVSPKLITKLPTHKKMNITFVTSSAAVGDTDRLIPSTESELQRSMLQEEAAEDHEDD